MPPVELSLCLIFRDEEAMLPDFLASVDGLWDELIAVDTGSVDQSARLLREAGAQVHHFSWVDDFAAARNASLKPATGRWILFLDADERVDDKLKQAIRDLMGDERAGAATVTMRNELPGGHQRDSRLLRLFRNHPDIRFRYRIHEDVSSAVDEYLRQNQLQLKNLPGVVHHLGYVREVAADRDKKDRDLKILRLALEQDPDDFYCRFKILEIARFWDDKPLWLAEAQSYQKLLAHISPETATELQKRQWSGELASHIAGGLVLAPNSEADMVLSWLSGTSRWAQTTADWFLRRAMLHEECGQLEKAVEDYQQCLQAKDESSSQLVSTRPLLGLCRIALVQGQQNDATAFATQAVEQAPLDQEALLAFVTCSDLEGKGDTPGVSAPLPESVITFLNDHPESGTALAQTYLNGGSALKTASVLRQLLTKPETSAEEMVAAALGLLVCTLVLGEGFDEEISADQETTDQWMRHWVGLLWKSRHTESMAAFAENCAAVTGVFPWLPEFLAQETAKLK